MLSCLKYVVVFYNFLFWLLGIVILGLSAYLWWDSQTYLDFTEVGQYYVTPFIILLILGGVMTIVGFLGCCGAVRESSCLLGTYFLLCVTMCIACGASLFWAWNNEEMVVSRIKNDTSKLIKSTYGTGHTNATEMLIDRIQRDFKCCGAKDYKDWEYSVFNNRSGNEKGVGIPDLAPYRVPQSCCRGGDKTSCYVKVQRIQRTESASALAEYINTEGCITKFEGFIKDKWQWILITGCILIGVQIFALIFACILCCAITREADK